jgi:hypothetical protein
MASFPGRTALVALTAAVPIMVGDFSAGSRDGWHEQTFLGRARTSYTMVQEGGAYALRADSKGSASGLVRPLDLDLSSTPIMRWSWKVAATLPRGDERRRDGDDYGARIYLIFSHPLPWKTRAIAYIWANHLPVGETLPNAYAANLRMVAVESGNARTGQWLTEERNVVADYRRLFGSSPSRLQGVGIMTDSDDTQGEARAWYGTISFHPL